MRGFLHRGLRHLLFFSVLALVLIQGCARPVLQTYPASEQEIEAALAAFTRYREISAEACSTCFDAEIDAALTVSGWFSDHTGKLSGYLQAMAPGYCKFIAVNPLGQPLFIFVTDGSMFKSFNVFEEKAYSGTVQSETYRKFAPSGFEPGYSYYWLTGSLQPGDMQIQAVMSDREPGKFWLQIKHAKAGTDSMVLFDSVELVILRHVLRDPQGHHLVDAVYGEHQALPAKVGKSAGSGPGAVSASDTGKARCKVPARITLSSNADAERIELRLHSFLHDVRFSADDFRLDIPENFEQLLVK